MPINSKAIRREPSTVEGSSWRDPASTDAKNGSWIVQNSSKIILRRTKYRWGKFVKESSLKRRKNGFWIVQNSSKNPKWRHRRSDVKYYISLTNILRRARIHSPAEQEHNNKKAIAPNHAITRYGEDLVGSWEIPVIKTLTAPIGFARKRMKNTRNWRTNRDRSNAKKNSLKQ